MERCKNKVFVSLIITTRNFVSLTSFKVLPPNIIDSFPNIILLSFLE